MPLVYLYSKYIDIQYPGLQGRGQYLVQSWKQGEHAEQCLAVQSLVAVGDGPAPAAAGVLAQACHAEHYRLGTRWAPAKAAGKRWR